MRRASNEEKIKKKGMPRKFSTTYKTNKPRVGGTRTAPKRKAIGDGRNTQAKQLQTLRLQIRSLAPPTKTCYFSNGQSVGAAFSSDGPAFPALGGTTHDRLGEKIQIKSLDCRFLATVSNADTYDSMRFTIVQYRDNNVNGAQPVDWVTNVFDPLAQATYPWLAPFNTLKAPSIRVLYDELICLNENGNGQVARNMCFLPSDLAITKLDFTTVNGGQNAGLEEGTIKMLIVSDSTAIPNPSYEVVWRLNFTDT